MHHTQLQNLSLEPGGSPRHSVIFGIGLLFSAHDHGHQEKKPAHYGCCHTQSLSWRHASRLDHLPCSRKQTPTACSDRVQHATTTLVSQTRVTQPLRAASDHVHQFAVAVKKTSKAFGPTSE